MKQEELVEQFKTPISSFFTSEMDNWATCSSQVKSVVAIRQSSRVEIRLSSRKTLIVLSNPLSSQNSYIKIFILQSWPLHHDPDFAFNKNENYSQKSWFMTHKLWVIINCKCVFTISAKKRVPVNLILNSRSYYRFELCFGWKSYTYELFCGRE